MPHPVIARLFKKFFHLKAVGWTACEGYPYLPTLIKLMKVFVKKKMMVFNENAESGLERSEGSGSE
jgi:hypothetical protein